jgi:hypothetical protein
VTSRYALHDVSFDLFVFQNRHSSVDQDRGRRGFEIRAEVRWRFLHVHCGHLEADGLQFGQEVQFHEVFLAEEARSFSAAIYRRRLKSNTLFTRFLLFLPLEIKFAQRTFSRMPFRSTMINIIATKHES